MQNASVLLTPLEVFGPLSFPESLTIGQKLCSAAVLGYNSVLSTPFCIRGNGPERLRLKVMKLMDANEPTSNLASSEHCSYHVRISPSERIANDWIAFHHD